MVTWYTVLSCHIGYGVLEGCHTKMFCVTSSQYTQKCFTISNELSYDYMSPTHYCITVICKYLLGCGVLNLHTKIVY